MSNFVDFLFNSKSDVVELHTIELSHKNFSQVYYLVANAGAGITAGLENGKRVFFQYCPMKIKKLGSSNNLDQSITISLNDLGDILPNELARVLTADGQQEKVKIVARSYRSDDLSEPLETATLFAYTFTTTFEGSVFEAKAHPFNDFRTGSIYTFDRFPFSGFR